MQVYQLLKITTVKQSVIWCRGQMVQQIMYTGQLVHSYYKIKVKLFPSGRQPTNSDFKSIQQITSTIPVHNVHFRHHGNLSQINSPPGVSSLPCICARSIDGIMWIGIPVYCFIRLICMYRM